MGEADTEAAVAEMAERAAAADSPAEGVATDWALACDGEAAAEMVDPAAAAAWVTEGAVAGDDDASECESVDAEAGREPEDDDDEPAEGDDGGVGAPGLADSNLAVTGRDMADGVLATDGASAPPGDVVADEVAIRDVIARDAPAGDGAGRDELDRGELVRGELDRGAVVANRDMLCDAAPPVGPGVAGAPAGLRVRLPHGWAEPAACSPLFGLVWLELAERTAAFVSVTGFV